MKQPWAALAVSLALTACESELVVGRWSCNPDDAAISSETLQLPWSTGFESEFCDFEGTGGFCYAAPLAKYELVTSPVRSGRYAAAFRVRSDADDAHQTRCVLQGVLPEAAYYGAWYFIPQSATNNALWNLIHFRSGDPAAQEGLWDVSLESRADGTLALFVFDFIRGVVHRPAQPKAVPIGAWFHLELYLRRALDASGEVTLYQDGEKVVEIKDLVTDRSRWGQWYIGNLATGLSPAESVVYVDDVTIRSQR